ncbi:unnamed protein product [Lactuca virosa]|uniref:Mechanosensitive ion channel MscS domain-containing protein n=1 Tax=Lactuca virosa TaxID=75947 RepID=A0AAU9M4Z1_9ASTR|nr:unnamed protein product [Lactuca virosa]
MSGISLVISKPWCRVYNPCTGENNKSNFGTSNKIHFGTKPNNKMDLIPCRLSNSILRISSTVATNHMLKHRVYSSSSSSYARKDVTDSTSQPPYGLYGLVAIIGFALPKAWEAAMHFFSATEGVLKSNACYYIFLGVAAVFVARSFLGNIMRGFALLRNKPFSIGDMIEVGHLKGEVIDMGLITTSLLTEENRRALLPTSWLSGQDYVNITGSPAHAMVFKIDLSIDEIEKIPEISEEIINMMRSNSIIYLEQEQPYCYLSQVDPHGFTLTIGCKLKEGCKDEFYSAKYDIFRQAIQIMKKHGAYLDMN